jgi:hypothetical protein
MTGMRACVDGRGMAAKCRSNSAALGKCIGVIRRQAQDPDVVHKRSLVYLGLDCDDWIKSTPSNTASGNELRDGGDTNLTIEQRVRACVDDIATALSSSAAPNRGTLVIVSTQTAVKAVVDLQRRKAACMKALSASVWTAELEDTLKFNLQRSAMSSVYLGVYPHQQSPLLSGSFS